MLAKLKYQWRKGRERWDLVLMGDPDCHAYVLRHEASRGYGPAWCWSLTMPRGGKETARGWDHSPHAAKRQVEAAIQEFWS